ncbi:HST2 [Candida pseudojiufengensis]|uniref:HST2 n=1 Tax=Candida pseudojiufengensis TaxID=497109 RepID=UPI002224592D|nr:HST2 [Candida pseudojiufengensis]KAI5966881.1 HST2 [Candida pseudojiufengensis]
MSTTSFDNLVKAIKKGKKVTFFNGAGISTSAGIPDFRSPDTGLYSNLAKLNLPYAEAVFDIEYFREDPKAFYTLVKELMPGQFPPTKFHYLLKLFQDKGQLKRVYTQNIDTLERLAGIDDEYIVEAHGSFASNRCIDCKKEMSSETVKKLMNKGIPSCETCDGYVKPDIVFFGEGLPEKFFSCWNGDCEDVDIAIIAGTSLTVHPFASLPSEVHKNCIRVLANKEKVGDLGSRKNDILAVCGCDEFAEKLARILQWDVELNKMYEDGQKKYGKQENSTEEKTNEIKTKLKENDEKDVKDEEANENEDVSKLVEKLKI